MLRLGPRGLDEEVEPALGDGVLQPEVSHDGVHRPGVHELAGGEDLAEVRAGLPECSQHGVKIAQSEKGDVDRVGFGRTVDGDSGDEAERALAADEEVLEVVAGVIL